MKQRSIGKMFLLTIVTLGIYRLYWFVKTRSEMMQLNKDIKIPSVLWLVAPLLLVILAIGFFIFSGDFSSSDETAKSLTTNQIFSMAFFYLTLLVAPFLVAIWLWKYSKGVEVVSGEKMSFAIALLILLAVPDGIDILIVQDTFNKIAAKTQSGPVLNPGTQ
jgi:hypothetical protein